jgi:hypothetical protein
MPTIKMTPIYIHETYNLSQQVFCTDILLYGISSLLKSLESFSVLALSVQDVGHFHSILSLFALD